MSQTQKKSLRMAYKSKFIFIVAVFMVFLAVLPIISAVSPVIQQQFESGYVILDSPQTELKAGEDFIVNFFLYNLSDGLEIDNTGVNCSYYLTNSSGSLIYSNTAVAYTTYWYETILGGNFTTGYYYYAIECHSTGFGGEKVGYYEVSSAGLKFTQAMANIYIGLLGILIFLFVCNLLAIYFLPTKDPRDDLGKLISINHLKYLKPVLCMSLYVILLTIMFVSFNISEAFLFGGMMSAFFLAIYKIMMWLLIIAIPVTVGWIIVSIFQDRETKSMLERGVDWGGEP